MENKSDGLGSDLDFPRVMFFEKSNYRYLEIRELHENSLRVNLFPAEMDVLFF